MTSATSLLVALTPAPVQTSDGGLTEIEKRVLQAAGEILQKDPLTLPEISTLQNPEGRLKLAKLCVQKDTYRTAIHIKKFEINEEAKVEIAKLCVQNDAEKAAETFEYFEIQSESARLEIAKFCAEKNAKATAANIRNFKIGSEAGRIEIAKLCAQQDGIRTAEAIESFEIHDENALIEIAKLCAKQNGVGVSYNIESFGIQKQEALVAIAKICAQQDPWSTAAYIKNFKIQDPKERIEIARLCALGDGEHTIQSLKKFDIQDKNEFARIQFTACFQWASMINDEESMERFGGYLEKNTGDKPKVQALIKNVMASRATWQKKYALLLSCLCGWYGQKEMPADDRDILRKICEYRNHPIAASLAKMFCDHPLDAFAKKSQTYTHLPMVPICGWGSKTESIATFLSSKRKEIKDARSGFLQRWLSTTLALDRSPLSPQRKLALIQQAIEKEGDLPKRLSAISALCSLNPAFLDRDFSGDMTNELFGLVEKAIQKDDFINLKNIQNFSERYLETWGSTRVPLAWLTYMNGLKTLHDPMVRAEFECMIRSVLDGTYLKERYRTDISPHLRQLERTAPKLFDAWQQAPVRQPLGDTDSSLELIDTNDSLDLFLSGEILGSCQNIHGSPGLTKCLLAYVMDGKNRMLALRDKETGKLMARAIFRLLLDEKGAPVLFLDEIYSANDSFEERTTLLEFAKTRAKTLGCPLLTKAVTIDGEPYEGNIFSLGSRSPYEYEDAAEGSMPGGVFKISGAKLINVESASIPSHTNEEKEEKKQ